MSRRLKLNVKNVILGYHNFSDTLGRNDYRFLSGFTSLAGPRSTPFSRPDLRPDCEYYKQDNVKISTVNRSEAVCPRKLDDILLKRVFSEIPVTGKWLDESRSLPIFTPGAKRLPWDTGYSFYYDKKNPQCPPSTPKSRSDCKKDPLKPIPPTISPSCPAKPKCYPCKMPKKSNPCANITPKNLPLHNCRLYSTSAILPKNLKAKSYVSRHLVAPKWVAITARSLCDECGPKKCGESPDPCPGCTPSPPKCPPPPPKCDPPPQKCKPKKCGESDTCPKRCEPKKKGCN